jgi:hypothetical protein
MTPFTQEREEDRRCEELLFGEEAEEALVVARRLLGRERRLAVREGAEVLPDVDADDGVALVRQELRQVHGQAHPADVAAAHEDRPERLRQRRPVDGDGQRLAAHGEIETLFRRGARHGRDGAHEDRGDEQASADRDG